MLQLADNDFKAAIINTFENLKANTWIMNEQIGSLRRKINTMKKEPNGIRELKVTETEIKYLLDELLAIGRGRTQK